MSPSQRAAVRAGASGSGSSPSKGIVRLALPLVVSFGLRSLYSVVDTLYAAQLEGVGDASVAAIGFTAPIEFLMTACWVGTSNGLTAKLATAMGARQEERVEELLRAAAKIVYALVAAFLVVAAGAWLVAERLGLEPVVGRQLAIYATVLLAGSAVTTFWSILPDSLVKAHQDTRGTMWAGLISGGTNVFLNTLFTFVFGMGIFGIALSTVLGRVFALAFALRRARQHEERRRAASSDAIAPSDAIASRIAARGSPVQEILSIAVPSGATFVLMSVEAFAVNWIVVETPDSTAAVAAWSVFATLSRLLSMPIIAIGVAMLPLVARLWGEGDVPGIRRQIRTATLFGLGYLLLCVTPIALFMAEHLARLFAESGEARVLVVQGMLWLPAATFAAAPFFPIRSAFEGMSAPRPGLVVSVVRVGVLVIPLTFVATRILPEFGLAAIQGAYAGSTLGALIGSVWLALWMQKHLRQHAP